MSTSYPQVPALLLAAGRGERMRPLTDTTPKPLLQVQGQPLLQHHMQALARAGVRRAVVNTGWLGAQIPARFGPQFVPDNGGEPLQLAYSPEPEQALETAGGIARAHRRIADARTIRGTRSTIRPSRGPLGARRCGGSSVVSSSTVAPARSAIAACAAFA